MIEVFFDTISEEFNLELSISKIESVKNQIAKGRPTIPSTLEEELQTNIFLRSKNVKNFSKLRDLKDNF